MRNNGRRNLKLQRAVIAFALVVTILFCVAVSPIGLPDLSSRSVEITPHSTLLSGILKLIPNNASIATENDIFPHVAQRENAYILTWPMPMEVEYILVDMKSVHFEFSQPYELPPSEALPKVIASGSYGLLACADSILLFELGYIGLPKMYVGRIETFDASSFLTVTQNSIVLNDPTSQSGNVISHEAGEGTGIVWFGPYAYFYAGEYQATFRMKTGSQNLNFSVDVAESGNPIAERNLSSSDFKTVGDWQEITLNFTISGLGLMEFRGICGSSNTSMSLDYVRVVQVGP